MLAGARAPSSARSRGAAAAPDAVCPGDRRRRRLDELRDAARGDANLLPPIHQALKDECSLGEVCGAMRDVFGKYQPVV